MVKSADLSDRHRDRGERFYRIGGCLPLTDRRELSIEHRKRWGGEADAPDAEGLDFHDCTIEVPTDGSNGSPG
jgi:hypothetical protein